VKKKFTVYYQLLGNVRDMDVYISPLNSIRSNDCVKIVNSADKKKIYCFVRQIDVTYRAYYEKTNTYNVPMKSEDAVVLCSYYRRNLGIKEALEEIDLEVTKVDSLYAKMRAFLMSPDQIVRVTSMLGLWSVVLGAAGAVLGLISILKSYNII